MTMTGTAPPELFGGVAQAPPERRSGWRIVALQECRDLWVSGRGPLLMFALSILLSVVTYLAATNRLLNFLEQREAVSLVVQVVVAVGVLATLVVSADAISGERERGTLETLVLAPISHHAIVAGKLAAALTVWLGAFLVGVPYVWVLGRGVALTVTALAVGLAVGLLLAVALAIFGLLVSGRSSSNKVSLAVSLLVLLALFAPSQLPRTPSNWVADLLVRLNPVSSGLHYIDALLVKGHAPTQDLSYLASPVLAIALAAAALAIAGRSLVRLTPGVGGA